MQPVDLLMTQISMKNLYEDSISWYRKNFAYAPDKTGNDDRVISALKVSTWILLFM